jgi:prepilin-type N-terminal cleavage/methylation domain-containing protein
MIKSEKGYTLPELMVVIVLTPLFTIIIMILPSIYGATALRSKQASILL